MCASTRPPWRERAGERPQGEQFGGKAEGHIVDVALRRLHCGIAAPADRSGEHDAVNDVGRVRLGRTVEVLA